MMLHPEVSGLTRLTNVQDKDAQPNAIDLRVAEIFKINTELPFVISEDTKKHRGSERVAPTHRGWYQLEPGLYEVIMENEITVPSGEAGFVITRSTLNRNGVFLTSGLYDSGYQGVMAAVMHVSGPTEIKKGTRIGQYLSFSAETYNLYQGSYGKGSEHDKKYEVSNENA